MAALSIGAAAAAAAVLAAPAPAPAPSADVLRATLPNGLTAIAIRRPIAHVVTTVVAYRVGSEEDPAGLSGLAHAQEHMLFRGTRDLSAAQLGELSAAMGGNADAFTEAADTQYYSTVPSEDLDVALRIEADRMSGVLDADADWQTERGAIEQEVARDRSDPRYAIAAAARATLFAGTPDAVDALGTKASFDAMTAADLTQFYRSWYGPDDAVIVVAGDLDPGAAVAEIRSLFGPIPRRVAPPQPAAAAPAPETRGANLTVQGDQTHSSIFIGYHMPGYDSPDYAAGVVLADVLSDQRSDLHWFPRDWSDGIQFWSDVFPSGGIAFASAEIPAGGDAARMVKVLKNNVAGYITDGFSRREVDAAKRRAALRLQEADGSVEGLALSWAQAVAVEERSSPDDDRASISAVTVDDVNRVAAAYLRNDEAVVGTLLPAPAGLQAASTRGQSGETLAPTISRVAPALPAWGQGALVLGVPRSALSPADMKLPNGLRLIVQPVPGSGTVVVRGMVAGSPDVEEPAGEDGVEEMLAYTFYEGAADVVDEDWSAELSDTGAVLAPGRVFSLSALAPDFARGIQLLADNELHPDISPDFFARRASVIGSAVTDDLAGPYGKAALALIGGLYPSGDPELRVPTKADFSSLTAGMVDDYYERVFRPDLTTIVVVGDVTPAAALDAVTTCFGAWKATGPAPKMKLPRVPLNTGLTTVVPAEGHVQDDVTLAEIVGIDRSAPDEDALRIADTVLGGDGFAAWLFRDVREDAGLAYSIQSELAPNDDGRSTFAIEFGADPSNVAKALAIVRRDVHQLQTAPVGADDLRRAKLQLLRQVPLSEQSQDDIADGLLARAQAGVPLDEPVRAAKRYLRITAAQVQASAAKWLRPDGFVEVVEGPQPQ